MNLSKYRRIVLILATGGLLTLVMIFLATQPGRAAGPWYVAPDGDDGNDCLSPGAPCASINGALGKASFGETIYVAIGRYIGTGTEVVLLDKNVTLSGGWDTDFTVQSGVSTIDGQDARRGMTVDRTRTALVERFRVLNGLCGGIANRGSLTLNNSAVSGNRACGAGAGGITNTGPLALNNSTISHNTAGTGTAGTGGGIANWSHATLVNSTVSGNSADLGGGVLSYGGTVTLQNTILAGNAASSEGPDCRGSIGSSGYNVIGDTTDCTFSTSTGDLLNVDAGLVPAADLLGYFPLFPDSLAIDAVPLSQCTLANDQRGVARPQGLACDMGAYEYTTPGPAAGVSAVGGTPQHTLPLFDFEMPLLAAVLDSIGSPVANVTVTFSAPASGASGTFADSGTFTTTAVTGETGVATTATFTANGLEGSYTVTATVTGVVTSARFVLSNLYWYVAPAGSDSNDCLTPSTACATINGALNKPSFMIRDTILVATGTYTGTGSEVVLLDKSATLSGGWGAGFAAQSGASTLDGEHVRRGMTVGTRVTATVGRFTVRNGSASSGGGLSNGGILNLNNSTVSGNTASIEGGGITNGGTLTLNRSTVSGNTANDGGGIYSGDPLILNNSTVSGNTASNLGGGIYTRGTLTLNNSTVSGNDTGDQGGGIHNEDTLTLNNSTISGNTATARGGGINNDGIVTLQNSILDDNAAGSGPDCHGTIDSSGYNRVGNSAGCDFTPSAGDRTDLNAGLGTFEGSPGYHPLLVGSPAINAGDPAGCMGSTGLLATDQRGFPRFDNCDIGAYELQPIGFSTKSVNRSFALPGDVLTYTITLNNPGDTDLTNVQVTDTVPVSLTYQVGSLSASSGSYGYHNGVITWTGSIGAGESEAVTYGATVNQGVPLGSTVVNRATISGGDEVFDRSAAFGVNYHYAYLSCLMRHYCPDFFDDFSDPASGWEVVDNSFVRTQYLNGEYRILTRQAGYFYLFRAPACDRRNYVVEVDARWEGAPGSSYGLIFGITSGFSRYYLFDMNTDYRMFRLMRRDPDGFRVVVPITDAPAIHGGTASNHLRVVRNGNQITLEVNGTVLGTWSDGTIGGWTGAGLVTNPYSNRPTSDARFDNFSVVSLPGSGASSREPDGVMAEESELAVPNAWRVPAPVDLGW
jgi:uncharacterized repeat protein (TIGR01451 family)